MSNASPLRLFLSSTVYELVDLREEISRFLRSSGFSPILSSEDGFPDDSPNLQPWESCLPVLDACPIVLSIIDAKYGQPLEWPNYAWLTNSGLVSPTHGEYLFAHSQKKRMYIFVRESVWHLYQCYRAAWKNLEDEEEVRDHLTRVFPSRFDYETFQMLHQIKTTHPIPWITPFGDVTQLKRIIRKKLANDFAHILSSNSDPRSSPGRKRSSQEIILSQNIPNRHESESVGIPADKQRTNEVPSPRNKEPENSVPQVISTDNPAVDFPTSYPATQEESKNTASHTVVNFAEKQRSIENYEKRHLARFAVRTAGLQDGQGAVLDAGTTCLEVWNAICEDISTNGRLLSFRTNSNLILRSWENSEEIAVRETQMRILGSVLDREHQAFFEGSTPQLLDEEHFVPAAVLIGTSGVKFDANGRMWFSYHAGEREGVFKQMLFKCSTEKRIIIATASKVGFRGANAFDILSIPDLDREAPLILVSTMPRQIDNEKINRQFQETMELLNSQAVQSSFQDAGLDLTWVILDPDTGENVQTIALGRSQNVERH